MDGRILCISDIHGCYDKFCKLLDKVKYDSEKDTLILLGDYCDRGSKSMETYLLIDKLIKNGAIALMGNHDYILKKLIDNGNTYKALYEEYYINNGTDITIKDYYALDDNGRTIIKSVLNRLLPYYVLNDYIFVHSGVNPNFPLEENDQYEMLWYREEFYKYPSYKNKIVVFGHTATSKIDYRNNLTIWYDKKHNDKIGIDCACVYGGRLACLDITNQREYYV